MKNNHSILIILAISTVLFTVSIYVYMYSMINIYLDKTVEFQTMVNSATLAKNQEQSFLKAYSLTAPKWNKLSNFFVSSNDVVGFIETIESLGTQSNSKLTIVSINSDNLDGAPVGKEGFINAHIDTKGTWASVMTALSLAEDLPYKISVNNVHASILTAKDGDQLSKSKTVNIVNKNIWDLSFDIKASMIVGTSTVVSTK